MKTFEECGINIPATPENVRTSEAAELAVVTYSNLGLIGDENKTYEAFSEELEALVAVLPEEVTNNPYDLVIVPRLGSLTLSSLIERYDEITSNKGNSTTYVFGDLWNQYSPDELNQGQSADIEARAVLLKSDNSYNEPGLYFTNRDTEELRREFKNSQAQYPTEKTSLVTSSSASYIIRNAMQLERGELLMDIKTWTRFVELDNKTTDGISYVPGARSGDRGRLDLSASDEFAYSNCGVRLEVGQVRA